MGESDVAEQGSSVLLDINDGDRFTFARLIPSWMLKIGKCKCSLAPLVGSPYGAVFELQRGPRGPCLVRVLPSVKDGIAEVSKDRLKEGDVSSESEAVVLEDTESELGEPIERDNRALVDDNTAQMLSADDIDQMQRDGMPGKDIVEALIANSTTYMSKTLYSQEKYKQKKQKKYAPRLVLRRPSARSVCEMYFSKCPQKIGFLRMDTLALVLSLANVGAHAEVLVMDTVGGLLTAAVAERMGGFGSVCNVYSSAEAPAIGIVGHFNFSDSVSSRISRVSLSEISAARAVAFGGFSQTNTQTHEMAEKMESHSGLFVEARSDETLAAVNVEDLLPESNDVLGDIQNAMGSLSYHVRGNGDQCVVRKSATRNLQKSIRAGQDATAEDILRWVRHGFTSLIIGAPNYDPWSIAQQLLPLLCFSSPFVIYHPYLQPLAECMKQVQANGMAVALQISEPWLREYQVVSSRTHPHMQMSSTGGYVLSGIKVVGK